MFSSFCISQKRSCYTTVTNTPKSQWLCSHKCILLIYTTRFFMSLLHLCFLPSSLQNQSWWRNLTLSGALSISCRKDKDKANGALTSKTRHKSDQHHFFNESKSDGHSWGQQHGNTPTERNVTKERNWNFQWMGTHLHHFLLGRLLSQR